MVYKLNKALYGLKQAPRAWYDTIKDFLKSKGFKPGSLDPTLFTKTYDGELFVCQIYVDDIIFGCTNQKYSDEFGYMMQEKYQMSMMDCKSYTTPMSAKHHLGPDDNGKEFDQKVYRSMIGSLLYLCASRPDIMLSIFMCARFQAAPNESHHQDVNEFFDI